MLSDKINRLMDLHDMTIGQLAEEADLPIETVKNIVYKRTPDPKGSTLLALSHVFNVSVNSLLGEDFVTADEKELLMNYRDCGRHGKSVLRIVSKYESRLAKTERKSTGKHKIPLIVPPDNVVDGIDFSAGKTEEYDTAVSDACLAIQIVTNNYVPVYCKGDIVLIADRFPGGGERALWMKDNMVYLREFQERPSMYILKSFNKMGRDMEYRRMDQIEIVGTCIGVVRGD